MDDRFLEETSQDLKPKRSCAKCFKGIRVINIGVASYACACDCSSGFYYLNSLKSYEHLSSQASKLKEEQLKLWKSFLK
jgi:hypothetical protein